MGDRSRNQGINIVKFNTSILKHQSVEVNKNFHTGRDPINNAHHLKTQAQMFKLQNELEIKMDQI